MDVPARFTWRKEIDRQRYAAYPVGSTYPDRCAWVARNVGLNDSWSWVVCWEGWFTESGFTLGKQPAADAATAAWWRLVETEPPRDVEWEVGMIVARVLTRPPPNSLLADEAAVLKSVLWNLGQIYGPAIKTGTTPTPVADMMARISEELARRRENGELVEPPEASKVPVQRRRRR
jgi:hypothetical protein